MGGVKQGKMKLQEIQACLKNANLANNSVGLEFPELQQILSGPPKPAAVLLPLLWVEDGWNLLFTRRTTGLQEHSGQVAFPGGRMDPDDCCVEETALREAQEEIGLAPKDVQLLGRLKETLTISNYLVTPLVGAIPWPYPLRPSPQEVSRTFTIPLAWLAEPSHHEIRLRSLPGLAKPIPVAFFQPYDNEVVWGASARFTLDFLDVISQNGQTLAK